MQGPEILGLLWRREKSERKWQAVISSLVWGLEDKGSLSVVNTQISEQASLTPPTK